MKHKKSKSMNNAHFLHTMTQKRSSMSQSTVKGLAFLLTTERSASDSWKTLQRKVGEDLRGALRCCSCLGRYGAHTQVFRLEAISRRDSLDCLVPLQHGIHALLMVWGMGFTPLGVSRFPLPWGLRWHGNWKERRKF